MASLTRKGTIAIAVVVLLMSGAGYLYGSASVTPRATTVLDTTTSTKSATLIETSTVTSTATWTETTYFPTPTTGQLGLWNRTTSYPLPFVGMTCVADGGFVYCVGGADQTAPSSSGWSNMTYYAPLSPTGVGGWSRTTDYPLMIATPSCVTSLGYIYCVSGLVNPESNVTADAFYAPLSPSGVGAWKQTTPFPNPIGPPACVVDSSYIYCVAQSAVVPFLPPGNTYFAHLSAAGVGNWTESTQMPYTPQGCAASGGYVYCFGGACPSSNIQCTPPSYYAPLSPSGVGAWTLTTGWRMGQVAYAAGSSYVYLLDTPNPLVAQLSSNGIGAWTATTPYPEVMPASCFANGAYLYCIGSDTNGPSESVYFTTIG
jgi:hypothetical protein